VTILIFPLFNDYKDASIAVDFDSDAEESLQEYTEKRQESNEKYGPKGGYKH
jgi:hypothetical protein